MKYTNTLLGVDGAPLTAAPGRVTQHDLARLAGLSQKTVHLALRGASGVSAATIAKVHGLAGAHGYRLNAAASATRGRSTRLIGVFVRNPPHSPLTHLASYETILGVDSLLAAQGYLTCLVRLTDLPGGGHASRVFSELLLDGVIVVDQLPEEAREPVARVARHCVWADADVWTPRHCIRRDEAAAGALAAGRLADHGVRRVLWVGWSPSIGVSMVKEHYSYALRLRGVQRAAARRGLACTMLSDRVTDASAFAADLGRAVQAPRTGIVAYNSPTALAVSQALARQRLVPGEDYSLVSCDSARRDDLHWPELARVTFDRQELGEAAGRMMLASIEHRPEACVSAVLRGTWHEGSTIAGRDTAHVPV